MGRTPWLLHLLCVLVNIIITTSDPEPIAQPKSFTDNHFVDDEKFREQITKHEIVAVSGEKATIPCNCTPTSSNPEDKPVLILWYKDQGKLPIYSFDLRSTSGQHWKDSNSLGDRGYVYFQESPKYGVSGAQTEGGPKMWKSSLNIDPSGSSDSGHYRCRVDFERSPTRNTRIKLKLIVRPSKPVIYSDDGRVLDLWTMAVSEGSDLKLYCKSEMGNPTPTLSWRKDKVPIIPDGLDSDSATGRVISTIILRNLNRNDQGKVVSCTVENSVLIQPITTSVQIDILYPPVRAKIVREWTFFTEGKKYNVSCQVLGSRPPPVTQLQIMGTTLETIERKASLSGNVSITVAEFSPTKEHNQKFLSCQARNEYIDNSVVEDQWKISVHYEPVATLSTVGNLNVFQEGVDVTMKCVISSNPYHHDVVWNKQGNILSEFTAGNMHILDETLFIDGIKREQSGEYSCVVTNQAGTTVSNIINIVVEVAPSCLVDTTTIIELTLEEETEIVCPMKWEQDLNFQWTMDSMKTGSEVVFEPSQFSVNEAESRLRFSPNSASDHGNIVCRATSTNGYSGQPCYYKIKIRETHPAMIRHCNTYNETFASFSIECIMIENNNVEKLSFQFSIKNTHTQRIVRNVSTAVPKVTIEGLQPSSDFKISVYSYIGGQKTESITFDGFTTRSGEKQLATKPEIESRNPLKLIPILGALILISLVLVLITITIVALVRRKVATARNSPSSQLELITNQKQEVDSSPDIIPKHFCPQYAQSEMQHTGIGSNDERLLQEENPFNKTDQQRQAPECSYAELNFPTDVFNPSNTVHNSIDYQRSEYARLLDPSEPIQRIITEEVEVKGNRSVIKEQNSRNILLKPNPSTAVIMPLKKEVHHFNTLTREEGNKRPIPPSIPLNSTFATGSLKKVKFLDQNNVISKGSSSLPRTGKDKHHLCQIHKQKLSNIPTKAMETVQEVNKSDSILNVEDVNDRLLPKVSSRGIEEVQFKL